MSTIVFFFKIVDKDKQQGHHNLTKILKLKNVAVVK